MPAFQTSPGMRDILPPESERWRRFTDIFADTVARAGYGELISPLLEDLGVFTRIGDATDVPTSKAGSVAHFEAEVLIENIESFIAGKPLEAKFDGHANCFIESGNGKGYTDHHRYKTRTPKTSDKS